MEFYTDGSSDADYSAYVSVNINGEIITKGRIPLGTSQQAEFMGVLSCLLEAKDGDIIYTDSQYTANSYNLWMHGWEINGWKRSGNKELKNIDLVKRLSEAKKAKPLVQVKWIPRSTHPMNKVADKYAYEVLKKGIDFLAKEV